ncbi:hypothetical protein ACNF2C_20410 [Enterobacter hormaechei]
MGGQGYENYKTESAGNSFSSGRFDYRLGRENNLRANFYIVAEHIESFLFAGVSHIKITSGEKIVVRETPEEILALLGVDVQTDSLKTWADIAQQEAAQ